MRESVSTFLYHFPSSIEPSKGEGNWNSCQRITFFGALRSPLIFFSLPLKIHFFSPAAGKNSMSLPILSGILSLPLRNLSLPPSIFKLTPSKFEFTTSKMLVYLIKIWVYHFKMSVHLINIWMYLSKFQFTLSKFEFSPTKFEFTLLKFHSSLPFEFTLSTVQFHFQTLSLPFRYSVYMTLYKIWRDFRISWLTENINTNPNSEGKLKSQIHFEG